MELPGQNAPDPRLQPTPDYGTLGPGSDVKADTGSNAKSTFGFRPAFKVPATPGQDGGGTQNVRRSTKHQLAGLAIGIGIALAMPLVAVGGMQNAWERLQELLSLHGKPESASPAILSEHDLDRLDRQPAQKQAELLLERALNHYEGANDQIATRVDRWHGRLKMTPNLRALVDAALNSNDLRVRAAGIELQLAAYNIAKTAAEGQRMRGLASASDHTTKIWALWTLGALANRGVEPEAITDTLVAHLKDDDAGDRQWAVEGLALVGSDATIAPLLAAFHDDASPVVRERAACSVAQSGMLTQEQRMTAVPQILTFTDDPALDAQTHTWAFQALRDITGQNLPSEAGAWREWWQGRGR
jgi:HEAT repeat protein